MRVNSENTFGFVRKPGVKKKGLNKSRLKPKKTVKIFKFKARFGGEEYEVYGREDSDSRAIFPREDKHPDFAQAEPGTKFTVKFHGHKYIAMKRRRWHELRGADFPCLVWKREK